MVNYKSNWFLLSILIIVFFLFPFVLKYYFQCIFYAGQQFAAWYTIIGVLGAFIGVFVGVNTYRSNGAIKKWELIEKIYKDYLNDNWYKFYKQIQDNDKIDYKEPQSEKLLNESLTLFDTISYIQTQHLLNEKAWEYIACEIQTFALNDSVWAYLDNRWQPYSEKQFPSNIVPFTGFVDLLDKMPKKYRVRSLYPIVLSKKLSNNMFDKDIIE